MSKNEVKFKTYSSFKNFREDEEKGILYIEGYASKSYHNGKPVVDLDNEFVDVTNFDLSTCTTLLFNHNQEEYAVGKCTLEQRQDGAYLRGEIHKELNSKVFYAVKHGIMTDMSIGFVATDAEYKTIDGEDIFTFTNGFVYETSICNVIGANPLAKINTHKSLKTNKEALEVAKWLEEDKTSNTLRLSDSTELKSIIDDEGKCVGFNCEIKQLKEANPDSECKCKDIKKETQNKGEEVKKEIKETEISKEDKIKAIKEKLIKGLIIEDTQNEPWHIDDNLWQMFRYFIETIEDNIYEFKWSESFDKDEMIENINSAMETFKQTVEIETTRINEVKEKSIKKGEQKNMGKETETKEVQEDVQEETIAKEPEKEVESNKTTETEDSKTESKEEVISKESVTEVQEEEPNQDNQEDLAKTSEETPSKTEPQEPSKEEVKPQTPVKVSILDLNLENASPDEIKEAYDTLAEKMDEIENYVEAELSKD